jgi:hypothetical protein
MNVQLKIKCKGCGKQYTMGLDTVFTSPQIASEGATTEQRNPDLIKPMNCNDLTSSSKESQIRAIGFIFGSEMLALISNNTWTRKWRCYYCGKDQTYKETRIKWLSLSFNLIWECNRCRIRESGFSPFLF